MNTGNAGRKKLANRYRVKKYMSKTKGMRFELHHRDFGYMATLDSMDQVRNRIRMDEDSRKEYRPRWLK